VLPRVGIMSCLLPGLAKMVSNHQTFNVSNPVRINLTTVRFFPQLYQLGKLSESFKTTIILLLVWVGLKWNGCCFFFSDRDLLDQMVSWDKLDRRERRLVGVWIGTKGNLIFIKLCRQQGFPDDLRQKEKNNRHTVGVNWLCGKVRLWHGRTVCRGDMGTGQLPFQ